jgi:hypothetical protein
MIQRTRHSIKVAKNLIDTQQFIENESNRVDGELEDLRLAIRDIRDEMIQFDDVYATNNYLDEQILNVQNQVEEHHDVLQDHTAQISDMRTTLTGFLAGQQLARSEPTAIWSIVAIQTLNQMAEQMNAQRQLLERLLARVDVLEVVVGRPRDNHDPMPGRRIGEASHPGPVERTDMDELGKWLHRGVDGPGRKKQRTLRDALAQPHTMITRDRCGVQVMESIPGSSAGSSTDPLPAVPPAHPVPEPEPVHEPPAHPVPEPDLLPAVPAALALHDESEPMEVLKINTKQRF